MRANIFPVGELGRQGMQLEEAIRNHSAGDVLTDEVQPSDIELLLTAYTNGTNVICSLHGKSIRNLEQRIMLGLVENPVTSSSLRPTRASSPPSSKCTPRA